MRSLYRSLSSNIARLVALLAITAAIGAPLVAWTNSHGAMFTLNSQWSTAAQNDRLAAINTDAATGFIDIYTGAQPANANASVTGTLLCSLPLGATAFHTPSSGSMTNNGAISCVASATGTAGYAILYKSNHTSILWMGSVGTSSANLIVPTVAISSGVTVSLADAAFTVNDNSSIAGQ